MPKQALLILSINSPLLAGLYSECEDSNQPNNIAESTESKKSKNSECVRKPSEAKSTLTLQNSWEFAGHTTHALNCLFSEIFSKNIALDSIYYAKGPGRFSALKATHIFLHTLCLVKGYALFSAPSFYFNNNAPIHAFSDKYFVLKNDEIVLESVESLAQNTLLQNALSLPEILRPKDFSSTNEPLYVLPPV